jgi:hypothetical protein
VARGAESVVLLRTVPKTYSNLNTVARGASDCTPELSHTWLVCTRQAISCSDRNLAALAAASRSFIIGFPGLLLRKHLTKRTITHISISFARRLISGWPKARPQDASSRLTELSRLLLREPKNRGRPLHYTLDVHQRGFPRIHG